MTTLYDLEDQVQEAHRRVEDADNALTWAILDLRESPCKSNFRRKREAEQKLAQAREAYDEIWQQYEDACAWDKLGQ